MAERLVVKHDSEGRIIAKHQPGPNGWFAGSFADVAFVDSDGMPITNICACCGTSCGWRELYPGHFDPPKLRCYLKNKIYHPQPPTGSA